MGICLLGYCLYDRKPNGKEHLQLNGSWGLCRVAQIASAGTDLRMQFSGMFPFTVHEYQTIACLTIEASTTLLLILKILHDLTIP